MAEDSTAESALERLTTQMCVQMEGEEITPEEFQRLTGWLHIGGHGKKPLNRRDDQGEPPAITGIDNSALSNKTTRGRNVRKEVIRAARMPNMPAEEIKIVLRPRGGLDIAKRGAAWVKAVATSCCNCIAVVSNACLPAVF